MTKKGIISLLNYFNVSSEDSYIDHKYMFSNVKYAPLRYANRLFFFNSLEALLSKANSFEKVPSKKIKSIEKSYSVVSINETDFFYYLADTADLFSLFVGIINKYGNDDDVITVEYDYISSADLTSIDTSKKDDFNKWFEDNMEEQILMAGEWLDNNKLLKEEFLEEWPLSRLKTMSINEYVIGFGAESKSLCYELEHGKYASLFLSIKGGSAAKFGMYWSVSGNAYHNQSNEPVAESDVVDSFEILRSDLVEIIDLGLQLKFDDNQLNRKKSSNSFINRVGLVTKLLCIYSDNDFFGVNVSR